MPAPKGNQFWKLRSKHGRDKIFASAKALKEACEEYFEWVEDNPLLEAKLVTFEGRSKLEELPKMRAMTIGGLCIFLDIKQETWRAWREGDDKGFSAIVTWADEVIRLQKFTGAAANMLNSNIIARDLGLKDASVVNHGGQKNNPVVIEKEPDLSNLTDEQLNALELLAPKLSSGSEESGSD